MSEVKVEANRNVPTWYLAEFPMAPAATPFYIGVRIIQRQGAHDIVEIPLEGIVSDLDRSYATGSPVRLTWGNPYGRGEFVGYIHHTKQDTQVTHPRTTVVCLGASYPLLEVRQRAFEEVSADLVVSRLAQEQSLGSTVDAHPRTYPVMMQDTISDWDLLRRLAAETGYVLRMEGTTLQFVSRARMEAYYKPRAQVYFQHRSTQANLQALNTIVSFTPLVGDFFPQTGAANTTKTVTHVDPVTGMTVQTSALGSGSASARAFFTSPLAASAHTLQEASSLLEASLQASKYVYRAKATLRGSALTAPERFVYLKGVPAPYGGYWTVLSVTHRVGGKFNYFCDVELGSDGLDGEVPLPTAGLSSEMQGGAILSGQSAFSDLSVPGNVLNTKTDVVGQVGTALQAARWTSTVVTYA